MLAAAVNLDALCAATPREDTKVRFHSEGYPAIEMDLADLKVHPEETGTTRALIRGVAAGMAEAGYRIGGFDAAVTSTVAGGSGLSSSAALEVMLTGVLDALYNRFDMPFVLRAQISQKAENVYFGKPSGLLDQMASAAGGLVTVDFRDTQKPEVRALQYDFAAKGYSLAVVATGGSHADLTDQYAAIPAGNAGGGGMSSERYLRGVTADQLIAERRGDPGKGRGAGADAGVPFRCGGRPGAGRGEGPGGGPDGRFPAADHRQRPEQLYVPAERVRAGNGPEPEPGPVHGGADAARERRMAHPRRRIRGNNAELRSPEKRTIVCRAMNRAFGRERLHGAEYPAGRSCMAEMLRIISHSPEETRALGEKLAARLAPGDVVILEGELGAGKSELARGIAKGLGVTETVTSPSFTILNVYESGRCPLYHFDWYRLESAEELYELGMEEYLGGDGIAVVEWAEKCPEALPEKTIRIRLEATGEEERRIEIGGTELEDETACD